MLGLDIWQKKYAYISWGVINLDGSLISISGAFAVEIEELFEGSQTTEESQRRVCSDDCCSTSTRDTQRIPLNPGSQWFGRLVEYGVDLGC